MGLPGPESATPTWPTSSPSQTTYPSWGYMIENGATTVWELWQNETAPR